MNRFNCRHSVLLFAVLFGFYGEAFGAEQNCGAILRVRAQLGSEALVKQRLASHPQELNTANQHGATALIMAVRWNRDAIVQLILSQEGIEVNKADNDGYTALEWAAKLGYENIIQMLLEANAEKGSAAKEAQLNRHENAARIITKFSSTK